MKLKAIIVEDEIGTVNTLIGLLNLYVPTIEVIAIADSVKKALSEIKKNMPDLLFLDMHLKGENGLDALQSFDVLPFEVIITTGYSEFAVPSYKFDVADYLLKPISPGELKRSVARVLERYLLKLKTNNSPMLNQPEIKLPIGYDFKYVKVANLIRLQANRNYTWVFFDHEPQLLISKNISKIGHLVEPHGFLRVHQSHIINPGHILEYNRKLHFIELSDGQRITVSRLNRQSVVAYFENNTST